MLLQNDTILLRKMEPSDLPFLYAMENDTDAWDSSCVHNPVSRQDLRKYISRTTGNIYRDGQLRLIIQDRNNETLGAIDLFDLDEYNAKAEVGIYLKPEARKKGIALQAVTLLLEYADTALHLAQVYALVTVSNPPSVNLFRKAGFQQTATLLSWHNQEDVLIFQYLFPKSPLSSSDIKLKFIENP